MTKIPFSIKYRPQIESGEYKVETRDCRPVCITCWDAEAINPKEFKGIKILAYHTNSDTKLQFGYNENGKFRGSPDEDLFIVTQEKELTEWQRTISACIQKHGLLDCGSADRIAKECSTELLSLARDQFIKEGYILEKKAFHDAVEKVIPEVMKEVSDKVDMKESLRLEYERGKAEALKDLPRWIPNKFDKHNFETCKAYLDTPRYLCYRDKMIDVSELVEKLPGFKD